MNINEKISLFARANDPKPRTEIPIWGLFEAIQGGEYESEIKTIRQTTDPEIKKKLKLNLPSVTISGTFHHRSAAGLIKHSGFICIDIDAKDNPTITDWDAARNTIGGLKEVVFCAISASGAGCFCVIPIAYPEQHEQHFEALKSDFEKLGLIIDKACKDISRLRFITSDIGAIINTTADTYKRIYQPKHTPAPKYNKYEATGEDEIYRRVRLWLDKRESFFPGNRNHYVMELAGGMHRFGASKAFTLDKCLEFKQDGFTGKEIESVVNAIYNNISYANTAQKSA